MGEANEMATATISVDEFQALEQKVLQTVELIKKEREARHAAEEQKRILEAEKSVFESERNMFESERNTFEAERNQAMQEAAELKEKLEATNKVKGELERERVTVRERVERMLAQMDELL